VGVPVGIIALYFLKLRRRPLRVPSTLLWKRSVEDLHVNSLFQRLRRNLLLFLQLLAVLLAMAALAGPRLTGFSAQGRRFVLAVDQSASMSATDVAPSRLAKAKEEARKVIESMEGDDLAMIIAFADRARVVSNYTGDRRTLLARLDAITTTEATTSLREALQVAAGLANPSTQIGEGVVASSVVTPKLGGFPDVDGFSLGNLEPEVVVIGPPPPPIIEPSKKSEADGGGDANPSGVVSAPSDNVAILALQTRRTEEKADLYQVFGRVRNFRDEPVETEARLLRHEPDRPAADGTLLDAIALAIPPRGEQSFKFDIPATGLTELEVKIDVVDAQPLDNKAFALIGDPRKAQVLVVTPGNRYLVDTLQTPAATERADVVMISPEQAKAEPFSRDARAGRYDLVIYDRFRPEAPPEANTLYMGALPPGPAYEAAKAVERPVILDWNVSHPLMEYIRDLPKVVIMKASIVEPPPGSSILIESNLGPLAFSAPREGFSDVVVTFPLLDGDAFNTTWFREISYPLFLFNALQVLGNAREALGDQVALPGQPLTIRAEAPDGTLEITGPDGRVVETATRTAQGAFVVNKADRTGLYHARWKPSGLLPFAVNQFDSREADLAPRGLVPDGVPAEKAEAYKIKIGYNPVTGTRVTQASRQDWWKPLAMAALGVLLVEWYVYNRRVYI
jgi:hypothetical protein